MNTLLLTMYGIEPNISNEFRSLQGFGSLKESARIYKAEQLIPENFGPSLFKQNNHRELPDLLEDRHGCKSTMIISRLLVSPKQAAIGEYTSVGGIMDRIIQGSWQLELKSASY